MARCSFHDGGAPWGRASDRPTARAMQKWADAQPESGSCHSGREAPTARGSALAASSTFFTLVRRQETRGAAAGDQKTSDRPRVQLNLKRPPSHAPCRSARRSSCPDTAKPPQRSRLGSHEGQQPCRKEQSEPVGFLYIDQDGLQALTSSTCLCPPLNVGLNPISADH